MRSMNKMSAEDIAKLKAVALYVLDKCGETDFIHLFSILLYYHCPRYLGTFMVPSTLFS